MQISTKEIAENLGIYEIGLRQKLCNWQLAPYTKCNGYAMPKSIELTPESIKILKKLLIKYNGHNYMRLNPKIEKYFKKIEKEINK